MKGLKRIFKRLEDVMSAAAFAEAGETETARAILNEESGNSNLKKRIYDRKSIVLKPSHT